MTDKYATQIWDKNKTNSVIPPENYIENGFKPTTLGDNRWLNYLLNYVSVHYQIPVGAIINYDGTTYPGALLCDGSGSIGSAASTATYADDKYQNLFLVLWAEYDVLPSRGVSAVADWAANKTVAIPNYNNCLTVQKSNATSSVFNAAVNSAMGAETVTLIEDNLPITQIVLNDPKHSHPFSAVQEYTANNFGEGQYAIHTVTTNTESSSTGITIDPFGGDPSNLPNALPHNNIQPTMVTNKFIKY